MILYKYTALTGKLALANGQPTTIPVVVGDDGTIRIDFDFAKTGFETSTKYLNLVMADGTYDLAELGTGTVVSFTLGSEHTKNVGSQEYTLINPYVILADNSVKSFPTAQIKIEKTLTGSIVTATIQAFITNYIDAKVAIQNGVISEAISAQDLVISNAISDIDASLAIKSVTAQTLSPGTPATASMLREVDGLTFNFGIPAGAKIISCGFNEADMVFTLDDGSTVSIVNAYVTLKGDKGIKWKGAYSAGTAYVVDDVVSYNGSSYICILASTGNLPTNATYFSLFAQKGDNTSASSVTNTPAGGISAVNVQTALNELDTEKADKLMATNLVTNGDFSNGTTGWSPASASVSVVNGELNVLASSQYGGVQQNFNGILSNVYYVTCKIKTTVASKISLGIQKTTTPYTTLFESFAVETGVFTRLSKLGTAVDTAQYKLRVIDARTTGFDTFFIKDAMIINLTAIFGAGKEPTVVQMDYLLTNFPNSWFNGTVELATIKNLLSLIQVSEAYITPTLLNSRTGTLKYQMSNSGYVLFKGTASGGSLNADIMVLPVGKRPAETLTFPISANGAFGVVTIATDGKVKQTVGALTNVSFDGIIFKAEA